MKQHLTPEQTAKLIELGLPKPRYYCADKYTIIHTGFDIINYSIGELIEMLPPRYNHEDLEINRDWRFERWIVFYRGDDATAATELVDALYDMAITLNKKGII